MTAKELKDKYPWVVGKIEGEGNDRTVLIKCTKRGCTNTRRTRTMDVFQVKLCEEHQMERNAEMLRIRRKRWRERDRQRRKAMREGEP